MNESSPFITPAAELADRSKRLAPLARAQGIDAVLVFQHTDLFYFSGTIQKGVFVLPVDRPGDGTLFVIRDIQRARAESRLSNIQELDGMRSLPGIISDLGIDGGGVIGLELDVLPARQYLSLERCSRRHSLWTHPPSSGGSGRSNPPSRWR